MTFPDIFTDEEVLTGILARTPPVNRTFTVVVEHSGNTWILYSLLFYLEQEDGHVVSLEAFSSFRDLVLKYFLNRFSNEEIFSLWMTNKPEYVSPVIVKEITQTFQMDKVVEDDYLVMAKRFRDQIEQEKEELQVQQRQLERFVELIDGLEAPSTQDIELSKKTIEFSYDNGLHSLGYYFDNVLLKDGSWDVADFSTFVRISAWGPTLDFDTISTIFSDMADPLKTNHQRLFLLNSSSSEYIYLEESGRIVADMLPFEDHEVLKKTVDGLFPDFPEVSARYMESKTIFVSGVFHINNPPSFHKTILQDIVLNDAFVNSFFVVNELEKASKFNENTLRVLLDTRFAITISNTETRDIRVQFSKCSSDLDTKRVQYLVNILMSRYTDVFDDYLPLYSHLLPKSAFTSPKAADAKTVVVDETSDFTAKYKNLLRKTGFKTACRPKTRVPVLLSAEDAKKHTNPLEILEYPRPGSDHTNDLDIPTEYFTCNDPSYKFPGISSLGGGQLFVPCCFNKNPRSSKAFQEYYFEKSVESSSSSSTDHIKSDNQIIKKTGDLGRVYPMITQLFTAISPDMSPFRVGVADNYNSILHAVGFLLGQSTEMLETRMKEACETYPHLVNGKMTGEYIDPRTYLAVLQFITGTNIVVFTKDKGKQDTVDVLNPCFMNHTMFYRFGQRPFVFLVEHWGSSPDRYTKRKFPICEPIAFFRHRDQSVLTKTVRMSDTNVAMINLVYSNRFSFSHQTFDASVDKIGVRLNTIQHQIYDASNRLRGVIVRSSAGKRVYMECRIPLPPLPLAQGAWKGGDTDILNDEAELSRFLKDVGCSATSRTYLAYANKEFYAVLRTKHGCSWVIRTRQFKHIIYKTSSSPLVNFHNESDSKSEFQWNEKMARILMDYSMYLYRSQPPFAEEKALQTFIESVIQVKPGHKYPSWEELAERIDANPGIMKDGRLFVTDVAIRQKLYFFVLYQHLHQKREIAPPWIFLPHYYSHLSDFSDDHHLFDKSVFMKGVNNSKQDAVLYVRTSLSEWDHAWKSGFWYNADEVPKNARRTPAVFQKVKSVQAAVGVVWLWNTTKRFSIPNEVPEIGGDVVIWTFHTESRVWNPDHTSGADNRMNIYLLPSENEFVLFLF